MDDRDAGMFDVVLIAGAATTAVVYLLFARRLLTAGVDGRAVRLLVMGWAPYAVTWFAVGRRFGDPGPSPSMRPVDYGAVLAVLSLLVSIAFDAGGFAPTAIPAGHVLPAVGVFVGLALFAWGLGRRSAALERMLAER